MPKQSRGFGQCDSVTGSSLPFDHEDSSATERELVRATSRLSALPRQIIHPHNAINERQYATPPSPPSSSGSSPRSVDPAGDVLSDLHPAWPSAYHQIKPSRTSHPNATTLTQIHDTFPDTPDATPSDNSSQPMTSKQVYRNDLQDFLQSVLPDIWPIGTFGQAHQKNSRYVLEDAVLEYVDAQWSGVVVIDTGENFCYDFAEVKSPSSHSLPDRCGSPTSDSTYRSTRQSDSGLLNYRRTLLTKIDLFPLDGIDMRTRVLGILDHAIDVLHVTNIIFAVDRTAMDAEHFHSAVHGLCYVGASIIRRHSVATRSETGVGESSGCLGESLNWPRDTSPQFVLLSMNV